MKSKIYFVMMLSFMAMSNGFSQLKKPLVTEENNKKDSVYMTWNKNTPEQEMNDDIKSLSEYGVLISYSNVKRNSKAEIIAIKVSYADKNGSKGTMELDNQKPINTIQFYKKGDEIGFGEPTNEDFTAGNFPNGSNFMKQFNLGNGDEKSQSYNFTFPNDGGYGKSSSKIIIQNDGKKPLVIEDGEVVEGGDDYSAAELEAIKKQHTFESYSSPEMQKFNLGFDPATGNLNGLNEQMKKMQEQLDQLMPKTDKTVPDSNNEETENAKKEMLKAKEEMQKAKEELQKTTEELKKTKASFKTQKA